MLGRQPEALTGRVVVKDPGGGQRAEPLPDVTLVEARQVGQLRAGDRAGGCQGVEQSGLVTDAGHQRGAGVVQDPDHPVSERLHGGLVELGCDADGGHVRAPALYVDLMHGR